MKAIKYCECGCGQMPKEGNRFIQGHNLKIYKRTYEQEKNRQDICRQIILNRTEEQKKEIYKKISNTKRTPEGKKRSQEAYQKCKHKIIPYSIGRIPPNKLKDDQKIKIYCLNCKKEMLLVPSIAKTRKFCSRQCQSDYRKGKPAANWNPNSAHEKGSSGINGYYKTILFRSSLELSFLYRAFQIGDTIKAEPFHIKMKDYLSPTEMKIFNIRDTQIYIPDYLVNNVFIVELKFEKAYHHDYVDYILNNVKIIVLDRFCKKNDYNMWILTDEDMEEHILTKKQIKEIPICDIEFFKEKHKQEFVYSR